MSLVHHGSLRSAAGLQQTAEASSLLTRRRHRSHQQVRALHSNNTGRRPNMHPEAASSTVQMETVPGVGNETTSTAASSAAAAAATPARPQLDLQQQQQQQDAEQHLTQVPRPAVSLCLVQTLPAQSSLAAAVQELVAAVQALPARHGAHASGIVRLEVPLPRGAPTLCWLRGQQQQQQASAGTGLLFPLIYFSPRRSTAPSTPGSEAASSAAAGCGSVAGAGAAWLWKGAAGEPLSEAVTADMQRFLSSASPRLRAFGGARFDPTQQPAAEWQEFGSFCFMIPRLELTETSSCQLLACTVAWDAAHVPLPAPPSSNGSSTSGGVGGHPAAAVGFASVEAAVTDALAALHAMQPPAAPAAGMFKLHRQDVRHVPEQAGWQELMAGLHADLQQAGRQGSSSETGSSGAAGDACTPLLNVNPETAREEYLLNGQEGLDDLLAALDGGFQAVSSAPGQDGSSVEPAGGLTKVVLARRTDVTLAGRLDPLALLEALQERDPRAYQLALQLPSGATFLASTPECLYARTGSAVASEAVAGTRARGPGGDVEKDFWLAFDLLRSQKDHVEFAVVRDWVQQALAGVCESVEVEVPKSVLKQGAVQHLYGKLAARLKPGAGDASLLAALHPTPAVCGRPRQQALELLAASEPFDRGYYAGPFGWISQEAAEFVVAIRSALVQLQHQQSSSSAAALQQRLQSHAAAGPGPGSTPSNSNVSSAVQHAPPAVDSANTTTTSSSSSSTGAATWQASLFAGVGIVRGSDASSEWAELDLKVRQYERLLQSVPPLASAPNVNLLWAALLVEELCRLGCNTFCVAPGSRSSPLTAAIAAHPRARIVPCIDERSLGFWALGYGRATGRPAAVVTTSGTAVANLLPAVVEAGQSGVPMLLLTGDRPAELRDTAANQTIDQVKIFGAYTRWAADLPAATDQIPARSLLTTVDTAVSLAASPTSPGPVHLNCQFREPLAPVAAPWDKRCLEGLQRWEQDGQPFTSHGQLQLLVPMAPSPAAAAMSPGGSGLFSAALAAVQGAYRGLIVVGELAQPEDAVAAAQLGRLLGWPVAADILSGLRAGVQQLQAPGGQQQAAAVVHHLDHLLLDRKHWPALRPDVVLQLGGRLTSKRTCQFLEWACLDAAAAGVAGNVPRSGAEERAEASAPLQWVYVDRGLQRHDQFHLITHRLQAPLPQLVAALAAGKAAGTGPSQQQRAYTALLGLLDREASAAIDAALGEMADLCEPEVARTLARSLPPGEGLFVGNSMPIRDLDMYASPLGRASSSAADSGLPAHQQPQQQQQTQQAAVASGLGAPVAANRGASGIDGVLSTAAGFADGLGRGCTLVVGDISFLHDINGLHLLRSGEMRPPLTVVLINNSGGGIFSFLPIADAVPDDVFTPLWATPQHVDLAGLCRAHGIPHQRVANTAELQPALRSAWGLNRHSVVEVITDRGSNLERHRQVQAAVQQAVGSTLDLLAPPGHGPGGAAPAKLGPSSAALAAAGWEVTLCSASYQPFSLPLTKPLTTASPAGSNSSSSSSLGTREGFLLHVALSLPGAAPEASEAVGLGEVAPLPGLHKESLQQAEAQLALVCRLLGGGQLRVPLSVALLRGRFARWLEESAGIPAASLHPCVRHGLETAVLSALAAHKGMSLAQLLAAAAGSAAGSDATADRHVALNGLLDCQGSPEEAAAEAAALVAQGYTALKLKVARRAQPAEDAAAVLAVRAAVGPGVDLRADANRRWSLEQALEFGSVAAEAGLEYIEEPVSSGSWAVEEFHRQTGIPVGLDETVDEGLVGPGMDGSFGAGHGVAALVLKPAVLGGLERTLALAAWARQQGMRCVISSAFESGLGVALLSQLAAALDAAAGSATHHGLATLSWFAQGLLPAAVEQPLQAGGTVSLAAAQAAVDACSALQQVLASSGQPAAALPPPRLQEQRCSVRTGWGTYDFRLLDTQPAAPGPKHTNGSSNLGDGSSCGGCGSGSGSGSGSPPVLFLHGFLGSAEDWQPFMSALSASQQRCLAVDLPGHGSTHVHVSSCSTSSNGSSNGNGSGAAAAPEPSDAYSLEAAAAAVASLVQQHGLEGCMLVGYSLGGRLALLLAARWPQLFGRVVVLSGTPGVDGAGVRQARAARDDALAAALRGSSLQQFVAEWYAQPMWDSLRQHPSFASMLQQRSAGGQPAELAAALAGMSPGRAPCLWEELHDLACCGNLPDLTMVAGELDSKFAGVACKAEEQLNNAGGAGAACRAVIMPGCGHAVHLERPLGLLALLESLLLS